MAATLSCRRLAPARRCIAPGPQHRASGCRRRMRAALQLGRRARGTTQPLVLSADPLPGNGCPGTAKGRCRRSRFRSSLPAACFRQGRRSPRRGCADADRAGQQRRPIIRKCAGVHIFLPSRSIGRINSFSEKPRTNRLPPPSPPNIARFGDPAWALPKSRHCIAVF